MFHPHQSVYLHQCRFQVDKHEQEAPQVHQMGWSLHALSFSYKKTDGDWQKENQKEISCIVSPL